jgi:phage baseplate assembly protein W
MGPETEGRIRDDISSVIARYEPRVNVLSIDLSSEDTTVQVTINYIVIATNQNQTLTLNLGQV